MRVVPTFDPFKHRHLRLRLALEPTPAEQLALEAREKALRHRVVVRIADRSHGGHYTGFPATLAERVAGVLAASVRMVDHRRGRRCVIAMFSAARISSVRRCVSIAQPTIRREYTSSTIARYKNPAQVGNVRDVRHPQPIRAVGVELPIDQIDRRLAPGSGLCRDHKAAQGRPLKPAARISRATRLRPTRIAIVIGELGMNVRRAVDAFGAPMDRLDLPRQRQIQSSPCAHRPIQPGVESTSRNLQQSAHHPDRMGGLVHLHEPEERFEVPLSVANQAAAFERISRSSLSLRTHAAAARTPRAPRSSIRHRLCPHPARPA